MGQIYSSGSIFELLTGMIGTTTGKRTSAQELRHKNFGTRTSAQAINIGTLLFRSAEVNIWCRSPQPGAEVTRAEHRLPRTTIQWPLNRGFSSQ